MFYKNCSYTAKTFYGVTFEPGQTKEVGDIINNKWMVPVNDAATKVTKSTQQKPSSEQPKEEIPVVGESASVTQPEVKETEVKADDKPTKGKKS